MNCVPRSNMSKVVRDRVCDVSGKQISGCRTLPHSKSSFAIYACDVGPVGLCYLVGWGDVVLFSNLSVQWHPGWIYRGQ